MLAGGPDGLLDRALSVGRDTTASRLSESEVGSFVRMNDTGGQRMRASLTSVRPSRSSSATKETSRSRPSASAPL